MTKKKTQIYGGASQSSVYLDNKKGEKKNRNDAFSTAAKIKHIFQRKFKLL